MVRQRLVKTHLTLFAHDCLEFLGDHEITGEDLQLFVDVARAQTQNEVTSLQHVSDVTMHRLQIWFISDPAMAVLHEFIDDTLAGYSGKWTFAGRIYIRYHNPVGIVEGAAKFSA